MATYTFISTTQLFHHKYPLTPTEFMVYEFLRACAKRTSYQTCFPSVTTIANAIQKSVRTIQRMLKSLTEKELIRITPQFRKRKDGTVQQTSNLYTLLEPCVDLSNDTDVTASASTMSPHKESFKDFKSEVKKEEEDNLMTSHNNVKIDNPTSSPSDVLEKQHHYSPETELFIQLAKNYGACEHIIQPFIVSIPWEQFNAPVIEQTCRQFFPRMVGMMPTKRKATPLEKWEAQRHYQPIIHPTKWLLRTLHSFQMVYELNFKCKRTIIKNGESILEFEQMFL